MIAESSTQSSIVKINRSEVTSDMHLDLSIEAEDSALNGDTHEFWGADWRIHIENDEL